MNAQSPIVPASATLATRAIIVALTISQWSGRRLDREVTAEVNQSHGATADASRTNKLLLPKEAFDPIQKIVNETRAGFADKTLPWLDSGGRIVAADTYLSLGAWVRGQRAKFDAAVEDFILKYPTRLAAARTQLGTMFKASDYPDPDSLRARFTLDVTVLPVPTSDDFRASISDAQAKAIRQDIEANVAAATEVAVKDVYRRIAEVAQRMVERLNAFKPARNGGKAEGIFRDSLVENVRDLIHVMPSLNITGSAELDDLTDRLRGLVKHDADVLRSNTKARQDVADKAQAILDAMDGMLG